MINNSVRCGSFTSSKIFKLQTLDKSGKNFGAPALTYIREKNLERKLGRPVETESYAKPMAWGTLIERYVFQEKLGLEYEIHSKTTDVHPTIKYWAGSKDLLVSGIKVGEIKCYEPKNFAQYTDALLTEDVNIIRHECPEEYWQIISNAIINHVPKGEAITYIPYKSELPLIREFASNYDGDDQWKYRFVAESNDDALPWIPDNGYYKDLNRFEFEIPQEDIDLLTANVVMAGKMLINQPPLIFLAERNPELQATIIEQA